MRESFKIYFIAWVLLLIGIFIIGWFGMSFVSTPENLRYYWSDLERIEVKRGYTPYDIVKTLKDRHPNLDDELLFWLMQENDTSKFLKAYYVYCLPQGGTYGDIIASFEKPCDKAFVMVTFPEGITIKEMAIILKKETGIDESYFINIAMESDLLNRISEFAGTKVTSSEGFLYPDTYAFVGDVRLLVNTMFENFLDKVKNIDWNYAVSRTGLSKYEIIVLASIVEKEAVKREEAPLIAGVFINRLRKGMKLEACPTVEYALGEHKDILTYEDLKIDSHYNTYKYYGLPPTPISNPSIDIIEATINYKDSPYLYFVADGKGGHLFAKTYEEHLENIRRVNSGP